MNIDLNKIREENIVEYGRGTRHLSFLGRLYADKTHFIFELLQNAEDAKAHKIKFILYPDRLEILHDGRIFNENDVRGICGVGEGTKAGDLTQIGKFGIGFKSVYAYTQNPEVHCEENHFRIENFVRPYSSEKRNIPTGWTTLFVFPFESIEEENIAHFQKKSFDQISHRLQKLSVRTLLFLRNLDEIEYEIKNVTSGIYIRESKAGNGFRRINVIGQSQKDEMDEQWIVFSRPVSEDSISLNVEIAFKIEQNRKWEQLITKLKQSYLNVFFPTEKETHLGFLIQGPYRTTPARDNIPQDDEWNKKLVVETAILLSDSLGIFKKEGLLNVALLETMPIKVDEYPDNWMFWPLCNSCKQALLDHDLLPTADKNYVKASNAKLARGKGLRNLIDDKQLTDLFKADSPLKWLSGEITQDRTSDLRNYLIYELDVEEIDPESFANTASREFFNKQTDQWHIEFYDFLNAQEALWRKGYTRYTSGTLRYKPIIRCKDGENYSPYDEQDRPQVFLPVSSEIEFPVVKPSIYANDRAKSFLENLGLSKPDICVQVVNDILACFEQDNLPESVNLKEYQEKINQINEALHLKDSPSFEHLKNGLKTLPWVWSENFVTGQSQFKNPSEIYSPIDDLCMYFENNQDIWFCSRKIDFGLLFIFMKTEVKIQCKGLERYKRMPYSEIELWSYHGWHGVGINCFDHHTNVDGLEFALDSIHIKKAIYIWNKISVPLSNFVKGEIKKATRQDFSNARIEKQYSIFGTLLTEKAWIPTIDGVFRKPSECCVDDLHSELDRDEKLIKKLGIFPSKKVIKSEAIDELRKVLNNQGIPTEIAEILFENKEAFTPEFLKEALKNFQEKNIKQKPSFPSKKSKNPERREGKVRERHVHAENKTYKIKERSVRTSRPYYDPKIWLKDLYTNDDNIMVCQMCKDAMPFRLKDGSYYFEAIQITDDYPKETHQLYLALCPLCGAMYQHLVKKDALMISEFLNYIVNGNDKLEIPLDLGKNGLRTISFVETHLCDAKIILKTDQKRK